MTLVVFQPQAGVVLDDTATASEGRWIDADKVRFLRGRPQLVGGWESVTLDTLTGVCRNIHTWADNTGAPLMAFGTHSKLQAYSGGGLYDITPVGLAAGLVDGIGGAGYGTGTYGTGVYGQNSGGFVEFWPRTWSLDHWGERLVAAPRNGTIYEWALNTASPAAAVTNAPARVGGIFVTPERILVATGSNDVSAVWNPMMVRWSDQENNTSWTPTALNQSGDYVLSAGSRIVRGMAGRGANLVWTDTALYRMRYLGDPLLVFGFDLVDANCGLIGPNAVAQLAGSALWMGMNGQFFIYDGGSVRPVECPVQRYISDNLAWVQQDKVVISTISATNEFVIIWPDSRDGNECSRYALFNYVENTWSVGLWDRTAWTDAGPQTYPVACTSNGRIYYHEKGHSADGGPLSWSLESRCL